MFDYHKRSIYGYYRFMTSDSNGDSHMFKLGFFHVDTRISIEDVFSNTVI